MSIAQLPVLDLTSATLTLEGQDDYWDVYADDVRLQDYVFSSDEVPVRRKDAERQLAQLKILQNYARSGHINFASEDWLNALKHILN